MTLVMSYNVRAWTPVNTNGTISPPSFSSYFLTYFWPFVVFSDLFYSASFDTFSRLSRRFHTGLSNVLNSPGDCAVSHRGGTSPFQKDTWHFFTQSNHLLRGFFFTYIIFLNKCSWDSCSKKMGLYFPSQSEHSDFELYNDEYFLKFKCLKKLYYFQ